MLDISFPTCQRWTQEGCDGQMDGRKGCLRSAPANKPSEAERQQNLVFANSPEFISNPQQTKECRGW
jgi:hypothetical protein